MQTTNSPIIVLFMQKIFNKFFTQQYQYQVGFVILLVILILAKWEALFLPFFWDEAWSYMPAIETMSNASPCLTPNCIDSELYRGHPLFFYFLVSSWAKWVGKSNYLYHLFALILSIASLTSYYRIALKLFSPPIALASCVLLCCQEIFLVQSSFVLPEVLIMWLTICMYSSFISKKRWLYFLWGTLLCLTKESGIIVTFCFILFAVISLIPFKKFKSLIPIWWVITPLFSIVLFLIYQKIVLGWYFFPLHMNMIESSFETTFQKIKLILKFIFFEQGRQFLSFAISFLMVFTLSRKTITKSKWLTLGSVWCLFMIELVAYFYFKNQHFYSCLSFLLLTAFFIKQSGIEKLKKQLLIFTVIIFVFYTIFAAANFFMLRYLLVLFPFIILLFITIVLETPIFLNVYFPTILLISFCLNFFIIFKKDFTKVWVDDVHLNYLNMVQLHQETVRYCENNDWYDCNIYTHFLMGFNLKLPFLNYLKSRKIFRFVHVQGDAFQGGDIIIFSSIEYNEDLHEKIKDSNIYYLNKRFEKGNAWCEVYVKNSCF